MEGQVLYYSGPPLELGPMSMGKAHYSYQFVSDKFVEALQASGRPCRAIRMPEFYATAKALLAGDDPGAEPNEKLIHLIFRSTEDIRLLKFAYNILCFAWEFVVLNDYTGYDGNFLANQVHMIGLCQEIWVPCLFTKTVLEQYGVRNIHVIPAPIRFERSNALTRQEAFAFLSAVPVFPLNVNPEWRICDTVAAHKFGARPLLEWIKPRSSTAKVFLSVLNPEDDRKNIHAMLAAFTKFSQRNPDVILIVKLVTTLDRGRIQLTIGDFVHHVIRVRILDQSILQSDQIYFTTEYLSDKTMRILYQASDYYLCTSIAEGQNLPLMEAMANGVVPISPRHTAMADYLDDENSIPVEFEQVNHFNQNLAPINAGIRSFPITYSSTADVLQALKRALAMPEERYRSLSENAAKTIRETYSPEQVVAKVNERIQAILGA